MPFAEVAGREIYYEMHGNGQTVVLLHHGFASAEMWTEIYPRLVHAGYRVVMYDRRGYGRSEAGADFNRFYVSDRFCEDSANELAALSEMLNLPSVSILGQCEGGVIGVEYAGRFPQKVRALVAGSTLCFSSITLTEFNRLKFPKPYAELDGDLRDKLVEWHGLERAEHLYEMARTHGGAYGVGPFDLRPRLRRVKCPTLVLYPDRSALFAVEQGVEFYRHLEKGELAVIPRCGHNSYQHRPELYLRHVLDFLERTSHEKATEPADFSMTCLAPFPPKSTTG